MSSPATLQALPTPIYVARQHVNQLHVMSYNYMIESSLCGKQYVGEIGQPLHPQMNNRRADIVHKKIKERPVAAQFHERNHNVQHMRLMIIDVLRRVDPLLRKLRESRRIMILETQISRGINLKTD